MYAWLPEGPVFPDPNLTGETDFEADLEQFNAKYARDTVDIMDKADAALPESGPDAIPVKIAFRVYGAEMGGVGSGGEGDAADHVGLGDLFLEGHLSQKLFDTCTHGKPPYTGRAGREIYEDAGGAERAAGHSLRCRIT